MVAVEDGNINLIPSNGSGIQNYDKENEIFNYLTEVVNPNDWHLYRNHPSLQKKEIFGGRLFSHRKTNSCG